MITYQAKKASKMKRSFLNIFMAYDCLVGLVHLNVLQAQNPDSIRQIIVHRLIQDRYASSTDEDIYFFIENNQIETNGISVEGVKLNRYIELLDSLGINEKEHWGFYHTAKDGTFFGRANDSTIEALIQHYHSVNKIADQQGIVKEEEEKNHTINNSNASLQKLHRLHEIMYELKKRMWKDGLINQLDSPVKWTFENGQWLFNGILMSDEKANTYIKFLKRKGIEVIFDVHHEFELNILEKEHWNIKGTYSTNFN